MSGESLVFFRFSFLSECIIRACDNSPHAAYADFSTFLRNYERDHSAEDNEDGELYPLYIHSAMRRRMMSILRHPSYSAMMCESIKRVEREIMFTGPLDVSGGSDSVILVFINNKRPLLCVLLSISVGVYICYCFLLFIQIVLIVFIFL